MFRDEIQFYLVSHNHKLKWYTKSQDCYEESLKNKLQKTTRPSTHVLFLQLFWYLWLNWGFKHHLLSRSTPTGVAHDIVVATTRNLRADVLIVCEPNISIIRHRKKLGVQWTTQKCYKSSQHKHEIKDHENGYSSTNQTYSSSND